MSKSDIVQRLLDNKQITAQEAAILLESVKIVERAPHPSPYPGYVGDWPNAPTEPYYKDSLSSLPVDIKRY